jgi:hypothetical protein
MKANKFFAVALAALTLGFVACKPNEPEQKLTITPAEAEVAVAATIQLSANMEVTWSSSDINIASVSAEGLVLGVAKGEATITAKAVKSNAMATCKVTVKEGGITPPTADISVTDGSIEDWKALPAEKVASCECPDASAYLGLKGAAVYADAVYINVLVEYDPEEIVDRAWTPFHFYFNTDNSDLTGGYGDQWNDANTDILMEGAVFAAPEEGAEGAPCAYDPEVFAWTGEVGGTGWSWEGLTIPAPFCESQHVGNYIEFKMIRELIPTTAGWNDSEFGIGFDIQQSWESVGILPIEAATEENPNGHTVKLQVKINK